MKRVMVVGGNASGKSEYAEMMARDWSDQYRLPVLYLATGVVCDPEFEQRVQRHRERRPSSWLLCEEALDPARILAIPGEEIILLDSLGNWVANLLIREGENDARSGSREVECQIRQLVEVVNSFQGNCLLVADEAGLGVVPANALSRSFCDWNGFLNQSMARVVDEVYLVSCGLPLRLK